MQVLNRIRQLDAFPKINEDFYSRSLSGGLITLLSSIAMLFLFLSELRQFLNPITKSELIVDTASGETIKIYSDDECCNSCEEVREAYRRKGWGLTDPDLIDQCKREGWLQNIKDQEGEGCNMYGSLEVNKVAGNFHFAPGKSFQQANMHVHDLLAFQKDSFNVSHKIKELSFGPHFPGAVNPLDGAQRTQMTPTGMYQYFIKVVPTVYTDIRGGEIQTNQFSVTEHFRPVQFGTARALPGVFFFYDLSPIKVNFDQTKSSSLHFLTNVCAIVGGVFTVSGIIDAFVYHGHKAIQKKMQLNKLN